MIKKSKMGLTIKLSIVIVRLLLLVSASISCNAFSTRSHFPDGFIFGAATSAYQIEGAYLEDGNGLSNWDVFSGTNGSTTEGGNGYIADDDYHRFLEDIEILHSLGVDAYRFSISWTRVLPKGKFGEVNPLGILFYQKIIDNLLLRGIKPFVTIHHFDYPQELEDRYGGWLSPLMQEDFVYFAETCFRNFGDRIKYWTTINEPNIVAMMGYERGLFPPGHCSLPFGNCSAGNSDIEPLVAVHNMMLAHGIVVNVLMYEPLTDDEIGKAAAERSLAFDAAWVLDPVVFGEYPPEMRRIHGNQLPNFTTDEKMIMKDSVDFIGINHYATLYAKDCIYSSCKCDPLDSSCVPGGDRSIRGFASSVSEREGIPIGEPTGIFRFFVVPRGMKEAVDYVKRRYHNKPMFITENGYSSPNNPVEINEIKDDQKRVEYHKAYLSYLLQAIRNGADVRGYFIWSLMDNFEWNSGYKVKFGLYYVDYRTLARIPRSSSVWYKDFLSNNAKAKNEILLKNKDGINLQYQVTRPEEARKMYSEA
ncbi:hypothetical protein Leryth_005959 [Lithospermum erythrorhizon]|nr:hypothetical protein Leryth_005959 [Lithospermum erythrorhizon]